jgi:cytoskeletal protein RodZ
VKTAALSLVLIKSTTVQLIKKPDLLCAQVASQDTFSILPQENVFPTPDSPIVRNSKEASVQSVPSVKTDTFMRITSAHFLIVRICLTAIVLYVRMVSSTNQDPRKSVKQIP